MANTNTSNHELTKIDDNTTSFSQWRTDYGNNLDKIDQMGNIYLQAFEPMISQKIANKTLWWDSTNSLLKIWNGSEWINVTIEHDNRNCKYLIDTLVLEKGYTSWTCDGNLLNTETGALQYITDFDGMSCFKYWYKNTGGTWTYSQSDTYPSNIYYYNNGTKTPGQSGKYKTEFFYFNPTETYLAMPCIIWGTQVHTNLIDALQEEPPTDLPSSFDTAVYLGKVIYKFFANEPGITIKTAIPNEAAPIFNLIHNELDGLNSGDYQHLTAAEKTNVDNHLTDTNNPHSVDAVDVDAVDKTNNQTVNGIKTFGSFPVTPSEAPTTDYQTANKKYVDDNVFSGDLADATGDLDDINDGTTYKKSHNDFTDTYKNNVDSALQNISEDTTPELGGEMDCGEHSIGFTEKSNTSSSGSVTINWKNSNKQKIAMSENTTFIFTAPSNPCNLLLRIVQDATGGRTITLPSGIKWADGTAPTFSTDANAIDILTFYYDGSTYYGQAGIGFATSS